MPKVKTLNSSWVKSYIYEYGENIFSWDGNVLFCKISDVKVTCEKRFTFLLLLKPG